MGKYASKGSSKIRGLLTVDLMALLGKRCTCSVVVIGSESRSFQKFSASHSSAAKVALIFAIVILESNIIVEHLSHIETNRAEENLDKTQKKGILSESNNRAAGPLLGFD